MKKIFKHLILPALVITLFLALSSSMFSDVFAVLNVSASNESSQSSNLTAVKKDKVKIEDFKYVTNDDKNIKVYYSFPVEIKKDMQIIFVMHGSGRDASAMIKRFSYLSEMENIAVIVPEFKKNLYNTSEYNRLNILKSGVITPYDDWVFNQIDDIFEYFIQRFELDNKKYILYGHSAGAQFTVRTLMFSQSEYLDYAIAANAGTYTFFDESAKYPYGIKNMLGYKEVLFNNLGKKLYILIGNEDTDENHPDLEQSFNAQGKHRYERAINFFNSSRKYSQENNIKFNWEILVMDGVSHNSKQTIPFVLDIITKNMKK